MRLARKMLFLALSVVLVYGCSSNNVHEKKAWKKYFGGKDLSGSFLLHNTILNTFEVYNLPGSQVREVPGATFNLMGVLTALETGVAPDTSAVLRDSLGRPLPGIDSALTLGKAFRESNAPYFSALARQIGRFKMQYWLDSVKYGNQVIGAYVDSFWVNNTLKISPDEQMGLLQQLYYGKLPFQSRTQRLAKALMLKEKNVRYQLSYTSAFFVSGEQRLGWIAGWIEKNERAHFFVMQVASKDTSRVLAAHCLQSLHAILDEQGYFKK